MIDELSADANSSIQQQLQIQQISTSHQHQPRAHLLRSSSNHQQQLLGYKNHQSLPTNIYQPQSLAVENSLPNWEKKGMNPNDGKRSEFDLAVLIILVVNFALFIDQMNNFLIQRLANKHQQILLKVLKLC